MRLSSNGTALRTSTPPHLVIPIGTKVLTCADHRVGLVSHVPASPEHAYRIRFADGSEGTFERSELSIFNHADAEVPDGPEAGPGFT